MIDTIIADRIAAYAYRYWRRHHMECWPSVARVANSLRLRRSTIMDEEGFGSYQLTSWYVHPEPCLGDHFVEATGPDVAKAWCDYYRGMNRRCYCGFHQ